MAFTAAGNALAAMATQQQFKAKGENKEFNSMAIKAGVLPGLYGSPVSQLASLANTFSNVPEDPIYSGMGFKSLPASFLKSNTAPSPTNRYPVPPQWVKKPAAATGRPANTDTTNVFGGSKTTPMKRPTFGAKQKMSTPSNKKFSLLK